MPAKIASGTAGPIGKALAIFGLVAFVVAALLSGSDRQSRLFPNAPSLVGWPYDTGAARSKAIMAFVQTGPASAIGYARRSIVSDPISAQTVSILARAQLYAGQLAPAQKTFAVTSQMGWRDALTQLYWMDQALQVDDVKVAAQRLDALLRQTPDDENRDKFLAVISATPEGRHAISERLKLLPNWAPVYATYIGNLPPDQLSQRVDVMLRTGSGIWDCASTEDLAQKLILSNMYAEAQAVWHLNCPNSRSYVYDGEFERVDLTKPSSGFNWVLSDRGDVDIALAEDRPGQRILTIDVKAAVSVPVLRQTLILTPGNYRLTWQTPGVSKDQARALRVSLSCGSGRDEAANGEPDPTRGETYSADFTVDSECPAHLLTFWLDARSSARIANVALNRL